ncbi:GntR family transcriptional regulator [Paraburkholderia phytofirmans]
MNKHALRHNGSPLHEVVRAEISRRIADGIYKPGEAIMSTAQLGEEFGVSSITVKRALRDLQSAGALTSIPGKGTFVKDRRRFIRELDVCMSSVDDAVRLGFDAEIQLISITKERIANPALSVFDPPDKFFLCVRRVIHADGIAVMYDSSYLPSDIADEIVDEFDERSIIDALKRHKIQIKDMSMIIDAAPASPEVQQVFSVPTGYPTLRRLYHVKTKTPAIAVIGMIESPFDRLACSVGFNTLQISRMEKKSK